jgi:hypothetical protein
LQGRGRRTWCRMLFLKKKAVCFFSLSLSLFVCVCVLYVYTWIR